MRHIVGLVLALAMSALLFFGTAWGVDRIIALRGTVTSAGTSQALTSTTGLIAVGFVVGTGLVIAILVLVRAISPLATGLPGLILLGWSALVVVHSRYAARYVPWPGSHFATGLTYLLFSGVLALIGALMIVPLAIPSRWHQRRAYIDDEEADDDLSVHAALGLTP